MKNPKQHLGKIIRYFKAKSTKLIHDVKSHNFKWQRNYYEHIIRNENELNRIREYIINNPLKWEYDRDNPYGKPDDIEKQFWKSFK